MLEDHVFEQDNYVSHIEIGENHMFIIYTDSKPANYHFESIDIKVIVKKGVYEKRGQIACFII